jgi:hypothetical protein
VHEHDPLLGRCPQDRLVLGDLDLDANWLEPNDMLVRQRGLREMIRPGTGSDGRDGRDATARSG